MSKTIGMSRNIKLEWLNKTAELVLQSLDEKTIKEQLNEYLSLYISSPTNLRKTREILLNIWVRDFNKNYIIRKYAMNFINSNKETNKLIAHWCMIISSYFVFKDVAEVIGSLQDKQYEIKTSLIKEKMYDKWGERTTLLHSIDKIIQTLKNLETIVSIKPGKYEIKQYNTSDVNIFNLITLTILSISDKLYLSMDEINNCYFLFPFEFNIDLNCLQNDIFSIDKFGGETVISIK